MVFWVVVLWSPLARAAALSAYPAQLSRMVQGGWGDGVVTDVLLAARQPSLSDRYRAHMGHMPISGHATTYLTLIGVQMSRTRVYLGHSPTRDPARARTTSGWSGSRAILTLHNSTFRAGQLARLWLDNLVRPRGFGGSPALSGWKFEVWSGHLGGVEVAQGAVTGLVPGWVEQLRGHGQWRARLDGEGVVRRADDDESVGAVLDHLVPLTLLWIDAGSLRDAICRREIYVDSANRWRNSEDDLPGGFDSTREVHYAAIRQALDATAFITGLQQRISEVLTRFDVGLAEGTTGGVRLTRRRGEPWISVPKLDKRPEPENLDKIKAEVTRRWGTLDLLDVLEDADFLTDFTAEFTSVASREVIDRDTLRRRLRLYLLHWARTRGSGKSSTPASTRSPRQRCGRCAGTPSLVTTCAAPSRSW
ncbi:hypothetical protein ABZW96_35060 [Nocardia sp. NPDC004168]|uniref:hypothetical protein n=1 Tax=Nocardia sp. NPDC004168 TaxID=3154452 RepID=UPI0033AE65E7